MTMKCGRLAVKQLKSLLCDFYSGDALCIAKDLLLDTVQSLKIYGLPKVSRRRRDSRENSDVKIRLDIDDLVATVTYLDENKLIDRLPIFFAANPDLSPSPRLLEGDMFAVLNELKKIEQRCSTLQSELAAIKTMMSKN